MSKSSELYNIRKRNISGDQERSEDGYNLFSTIAAPDSTAFAARLELESELSARLRYCRAFIYGLKKVLPEGEQEKLYESIMNQDGAAQGISPAMAARILAHRSQFERIKELYPWQGAEVFERRLFGQLRRIDEQNKAIKESAKKWREEHREELKEKKRKWNEANAERISEKYKTYRAANLEKIRAKDAKWRERNKEHILKYQRAYRAANREKMAEYKERNKERIQEYKRTYRAANREKIREYKRAYYAKKRAEKLQSEDKGYRPFRRGYMRGNQNCVLKPEIPREA